MPLIVVCSVVLLLLLAVHTGFLDAFAVPIRELSTIRPRQRVRTSWIQAFVLASKVGAEEEGEAAGTDDDNDISIAATGVTLKMAFDAQWGVADLSEEKSERFTCGESLDMVHRLRRCSDAVLVGRTTVERDDCTLTVRRVELPPQQPQPVRVVIDPRCQLEWKEYKIVNDGLPTIMVSQSHDNTKSKEFPNVQCIQVPPTVENDGKLSPREIVRILKTKHDIHHIMVEGGPMTARQFLKEGIVDRAILVHASINFKEPLPSNLSSANFEEAGLKCVGEGTLGVDRVEYWSRPELPWPADPTSSWP